MDRLGSETRKTGAAKRFEADTARAFIANKPVKPVVPAERVDKSTKLADLPHGQPSYGFVPTEQKYHDELMSVLYKIFAQLERVVLNTEPKADVPPEHVTASERRRGF